MTPDPSTGQILPGSKFGDKLTELAREAKVIVEIGTWKGGGSTECIRRGLSARSWFITVESNFDMYILACELYGRQPNVWSVWGTLVTPDEFPPYWDHPVEDRRKQWAFDKEMCHTPYALPIIPPEIDLLLLDGGEWSSHVEYEKLKHRSKIIALDDTHACKSIKNCDARLDMLDYGWTCLADELDDRNGWFIGRRP